MTIQRKQKSHWFFSILIVMSVSEKGGTGQVKIRNVVGCIIVQTKIRERFRVAFGKDFDNQREKRL